MSAADMARASFLLTGPQRFPLFGADDGVNLFLFPLMDLPDLLPFLLRRERGVGAHGLDFLVRLAFNRSTLLYDRLRDARDLPARFLLRVLCNGSGHCRGCGADGSLSDGFFGEPGQKKGRSER